MMKGEHGLLDIIEYWYVYLRRIMTSKERKGMYIFVDQCSTLHIIKVYWYAMLNLESNINIFEQRTLNIVQFSF